MPPAIIVGMKALRGLLRTPWRATAAVLLVALLAATIYRAATQAVAHDEGVMFEWFQAGPWSQLFDSPFGNHHPLTVLFSRVSISIFATEAASQESTEKAADWVAANTAQYTDGKPDVYTGEIVYADLPTLVPGC